MSNVTQERLEQLRAEYANGENMMAELREKQVNLHESMLRIAGAIQVLEELEQNSGSTEGDDEGEDAAVGVSEAPGM